MATSTISVTPGTYRLNRVHSTVGFAVMHKVSRFRASFGDFDAILEVAPDGGMALSGAAEVASVQVKHAEQAAHLRSPEFFDATRHPSISFSSTTVTVGP